ncbi:MAG: hypothetical protein D3906_14905, partial [Candidatus Electrothrix sp. AUS1_2]|nr:hypothetical protein [Candidatus Electrothrix sp. AUS1_2]
QEQGFSNRLHLTGTLTRSVTGLRVAYELRGSPDEILLPLADTSPRRRDELWRATCFEFFFGKSGSPQYREVNLSPRGIGTSILLPGIGRGCARKPP